MSKDIIINIVIWSVILILGVSSFLSLMIASAKEEKRRKREKDGKHTTKK